MRKKILAWIAAVALLLTALPMDVLAAQETTYHLEGTTLSAVIPMAGTEIDFGGILQSADLTIKADTSKEVTLSFMEIYETTIFKRPAEASADAPSESVQVAYQSGETWVDAAVTIYESGVLKSMTFPIDEFAETYEIALAINGSQFGGDNPYKLSTGGTLSAILTMDWSNVPAEDEGEEVKISNGTYTGTTTANNGTVYTYKLELKEDKTYTYYVEFTMGEEVYSNTETGTYTVDDETSMTFTVGESEIKEGEVYQAVITGKNSFTLTRFASYFSLMSGKTADIPFVFADKDSADNNDKDDTAKDDTIADDTNKDDAIKDDTTKDDTTNGEDNKNNTANDSDIVDFGLLASGKYAVDLTWVPFMDAMLDPIVEINTTEKTFKVYNEKDPAILKGNGTITFDKETDVYTLMYETEESAARNAETKTTTFTYVAETKTITFTSPLYYGASSFNNTDDNGKFVSYGAVLVTEDTVGSENDKPNQDTTTGDTNTDNSSQDTTSDINTDAANKKDNEKADSVDSAKKDTDKTSPKGGETAKTGVYAMLYMAAFGEAVVVLWKKKNRV